MRGADDVVLDLQILEQELDRQIVVRLDPAHLGGRQNDKRRFFLREKTSTARSSRQIEFGAIRVDQIGKTVRLQAAHQGAADEAAMAGNEDFIRFVHSRSGAV